MGSLDYKDGLVVRWVCSRGRRTLVFRVIQVILVSNERKRVGLQNGAVRIVVD